MYSAQFRVISPCLLPLCAGSCSGQIPKICFRTQRPHHASDTPSERGRRIQAHHKLHFWLGEGYPRSGLGRNLAGGFSEDVRISEPTCCWRCFQLAAIAPLSHLRSMLRICLWFGLARRQPSPGPVPTSTGDSPSWEPPRLEGAQAI